MIDKIKVFIANSLVFKNQLKIGFWSFLIVGLLLFAIWHVSRVSFLNITKININDKSLSGIDTEVVRRVADEELSGLYLKFIPRSFILFYPKREIKEKILGVDYVKNVYLHLDKFSVLDIKLDEHIPHALWCNYSDAGDCWFVNDESEVFVKSPNLEGSELLRLFKEDYLPKKGDVYLDYENWLKVQKMVELLKDKKWYIKTLILDKKNDFSATLVGGGKLIFNFNLSPEVLVDNLFTALKADEFKNIKPGNFT